VKKLYIRYFENKDGIPTNSVPLEGCPFCEGVNENLMSEDEAEDIAKWMNEHPEGKVDVVWLNS
jgi:hypothetical protein